MNALRQEFGIKQTQFAKYLGLNQPVLSMYETNVLTLPKDISDKISLAFNVPAEYLQKSFREYLFEEVFIGKKNVHDPSSQKASVK
jgi:transcriptional regulator with XRE-family HTH domain